MKTKNEIWLCEFIVLGLVLILANSCKKDKLPIISTSKIVGITETSAICGGTVTSEGSEAVLSRGICWSTTPNPTVGNSKTLDGTGIGTFTSNLTGLNINTSYYVSAYATNSAGTAYGNDLFFATQGRSGSVTDIGGISYSTIEIGSQTWMAENLKTTKYNNGESIPLVSEVATWSTLTTPAYCWYNNDEDTFKETYGALYNWYSVNSIICPAGWHVPTDAEWTTLTNYLGGESVAGGKLKSTGTIEGGHGLWRAPNTGATNETGFTALPGGYRYYYGEFNYDEFSGYWWSSTENSTTDAYSRGMLYDLCNVNRTYPNKQSGLSVRCLKDN